MDVSTDRRSIGLIVVFAVWALSAVAHPGSGIATGADGQVYFTYTGSGFYKIDATGALSQLDSTSFHFLAIDEQGTFREKNLPRVPSAEFKVVGDKPGVILASSFPAVVGTDGAFYYPEDKDGAVQLMRVTAKGERSRFATLPAAIETSYEGKQIRAEWIHGLANGPDGTLYYAEKGAVRRVNRNGRVTTVAENISVPDYVRPPSIEDDRVVPALRDLEVATDGTVYVAASACSALVRISPGGEVSVALRAESPWSPSGVAILGEDVYVLEHRYIKADRPIEWNPRVRKLSKDGAATIVAEVDKSSVATSNKRD